MRRNGARRMLRAAGLGLFLGVLGGGAPGCESPAPTISLPPLPPPPAPLPDLGDERATARCGAVSITATPPRRPGDTGCSDYVVDFSVETENGEAMIFDLFRHYAISDWRVRRIGGRFRHDVSLNWYSLDHWHRSSLPAEQPLIIPACPEGEEGPVLACTEFSCDVHASLDTVQPFVPSWAGLIVRVPWGSSTVHDLRVGETLSIPYHYTAYADLGQVTLLSAHGESVGRFRTTPAEYNLGSLRAGDSGTVVFRVTPGPKPLVGTEVIATVNIRVEREVCKIPPNHTWIRVVDTP